MSNSPAWPSAFSASVNKVQHYLLDEQSQDGAEKARFLLRYGFTVHEPFILLEAVVRHPGTSECVLQGETKLGQPRLTYEGRLETPDGRNPIVQTGWRLTDDDEAEFITLIPRPMRANQRARAFPVVVPNRSDRP